MARPRIVLVNPRICRAENARLPLSLLALAAALESEFTCELFDGNLDPQALEKTVAAAAGAVLVGVSVMPGPQVAPAIAVSAAVRQQHPAVPIVWGGYFPTLYPDSAINAPYVDAVVRGQGEETLLALARLWREPASGVTSTEPDSTSRGQPASLASIAGVTYREAGTIRHNPERPFRPPAEFPPLPYTLLDNVPRYLRPTFMGRRTAVVQAAIGCRYRCSFCGVVSMFQGYTRATAAERLSEEIQTLRDRWQADSLQFYDHNFFDREETSRPLLEVLEKYQLPWWCYARADALAEFSETIWRKIARSRLRMAYIGAEAASDEVLAGMKKGTAVEQTFAAARKCREHGVIPEFSFVLGGPHDPEEELERSFRLIRQLKQLHPECEVILYFYSPTPQRDPTSRRADADAPRIPVLTSYGPGGPELPTTPEEWTTPRWVDYVCHRDAPWLTDRTRRRVRDFARVLACRFPTVQDARTPRWGKAVLRELARWRYATGIYARPWELRWAQQLIPLREPQRESL